MRTQTYTIPGNPIPLARPRFGQGRVWDEQKTLKFNVGLFLAHQHANQPYFTGPLAIVATFYLPIPKGQSKKLNGKYHIYKPDIDNLEKFLLDSAQSIIFGDDCIVSVISATKQYDSNPRTVFTVTELE